MSTDAIAALPPTAIALLRRHNLLAPLARAEVVADAVQAVELDPALREGLLKAYCEARQLSSEEQLEAHLQEIGFSRGDLQWQLELPHRIQAYSDAQFGHKAEARFLARKEQLDRVVYSLLRVSDPFLAQELYLRIAGGEANFGDLAAEHAEGPEQGTKGIVGPVPLTQAHPALAERLRTSRPGQLMEPFQIAEWWLVARLERYEPARFDDNQAKQMSQELFQEWVQGVTASKLSAIPRNQGGTAQA
jgi:parvulin-like peptidyl-prolyl isomerase